MSLDLQSVIVFAAIAVACVYAGKWLRDRAASFSRKGGCGNDCGCDSTPKTKANIETS